jgi:hypothetical protein
VEYVGVVPNEHRVVMKVPAITLEGQSLRAPKVGGREGGREGGIVGLSRWKK